MKWCRDSNKFSLMKNHPPQGLSCSFDWSVCSFLPEAMLSLIECRTIFSAFFIVLFFSDCLIAFKITGATGGIDPTTGARPLRYEIHDFANSGPSFDLLILALLRFQGTNQSDSLSYFQISGLSTVPPFRLKLTDDRDSRLPPNPMGWSLGEW